ncbi:MAG: tripartite tricarboxylate transporter permease [Ectothiorhodospiraceae bacterium]|nr:tripartite tricarboxylate transporter permease [Ectothiorhodospiraceae bacterium]
MDLPFHLFPELFWHAFSLWYVIIPAVLLGIIVGAIPGFSAANTIIILLPLALSVDVETGLVFMVALYSSSRMGAGIPAILVNIPGTGGAAATPLDGYPMTQQGRAPQALAMSFMASTFGGLFTSVVALFCLPILTQVVYYVHSVEMVVIMLFGMSLIASIAARDPLKGLVAGLFGMMLGAIGADHIYGTPRGTMGFLELYDGLPIIPALVGLFALSEAFLIIEGESIVSKAGRDLMVKAGWGPTIEGVKMTIERWWHVVWTSLIGLLIGIVPGAGAGIAAFTAYQQSRFFSKTPDLYGTGHPEGLIAPESANNGVTSGTLIPLLVLGLPGGLTAAVMMIVLQLHDVLLGPQLFVEDPKLAYGVIMTMAVTYIFMIPTILPLARYMSRITLVSTSYMTPTILSFTLTGAFVARDYAFDMYLALVFGAIGYVARKTGFHVAAILIGCILGPLLEQYLLRAMRISEGDPMVLFSSTLGNVLWVLLVVTLVFPYLFDWMRKRRAAAEAGAAEARS